MNRSDQSEIEFVEERCMNVAARFKSRKSEISKGVDRCRERERPIRVQGLEACCCSEILGRRRRRR